MLVDDDALIDESTGKPLPTERWLRHPPLISFYMHTHSVYRAIFGCNPEQFASIAAELEVEMQEKSEATDN